MANKLWIMDYSYLVWQGTYAIATKCACAKNINCPKCNGNGYDFLVNRNGEVVGGLYFVFKQMLSKIKDGWDIIVAIDPPKKQLTRCQLLDTYKDGRAEPDIIKQQKIRGKELFPKIPRILCYTSDHDESDDIMAKLAIDYVNNGYEVVISSKDKDMYPLLEYDKISIYRDGMLMFKEAFIRKYGFNPCRFNEYLALAGDSADNFNLFKGIGDKAARSIIEKTSHISEVFQPRVWKTLSNKQKEVLSDKNGNHRINDLELSLKIASLNYNANCYLIDDIQDREYVRNSFIDLGFKEMLANMHIFFNEIEDISAEEICD